MISVSGELDLASGPQLEQVLDGITGSSTDLVIIDLSQLDFMDSTGLSIIVKAHQRLQGDGRELGLVRGPAQVQRLLDLTGVAGRLRLVDAADELIAGG